METGPWNKPRSEPREREVEVQKHAGLVTGNPEVTSRYRGAEDQSTKSVSNCHLYKGQREPGDVAWRWRSRVAYSGALHGPRWGTSIRAVLISSHVRLQGNRGTRRSLTTFSANTRLLLPDSITELRTTLIKYLSINHDSDDNPLVVWEAHKPVVRGVLIRIGSHLKKERTR